jgi:hypothetical protein
MKMKKLFIAIAFTLASAQAFALDDCHGNLNCDPFASTMNDEYSTNPRFNSQAYVTPGPTEHSHYECSRYSCDFYHF